MTRCYAKFEKPFKAVRCAPFVGAHLCLQGRSSFDRQTGPGAWLATHSGLPNQSSEDLHFELRQLRDFDREWFDEAFAIELCLGLAQLANIGNPR